LIIEFYQLLLKPVLLLLLLLLLLLPLDLPRVLQRFLH
jgi:hypothetical protein